MKIKKPKLLAALILLVVSTLALTEWMRNDRLEKEDAHMRSLVKETVNSEMPENLKK